MGAGGGIRGSKGRGWRRPAVCAVAYRHGLAVISDEIYAELGHRGTVCSPVQHLGERTVVTTGLSKSLALGGWRIGFARPQRAAGGGACNRN